ncbi:hypothetical protein [Streptomyces sp. WAC06614]|uniref:hypothetical protein n=1 Tax=Streptomyces sp. WAC06614 TaxID=2487416 RepID=UPI000F7A440E|nr:hypothetical protein [Streptomyces sp. WAC06614]RSS78235.1 hypothetical protein EF918_21725 [Streptomyces sp. WAC06614]
MPYVVLGRSCDLGAGVPARVVVPARVTLHLMAGEDVTVGLDQPSLAQQMGATGEYGPGSELDNLAMTGLLDRWDEEDRQFDPFELVLPDPAGAPVHLCTDSAGSCPTTAEQVEAGAGHTCDGVLGAFPGRRLFWMTYDTILPVNGRALRRLPLLLSAETVLGTTLRTRTEAVLRSELPAQTMSHVPLLTQDVVGGDPRRFVRRVARSIKEWAAAGRPIGVRELLRDALGDDHTAQLAEAMADFTEEVLQDQTQELLEEDLLPLAELVRQEAEDRGTRVDLADAVDVLQDLLTARLGGLAGERADLVEADLQALDTGLASFRCDLQRAFVDTLVRSLAEVFHRTAREVLRARHHPRPGAAAPAA